MVPTRREFNRASEELVTQYSKTYWTQIPQISQIFKKIAWLDRLKKWEPVRHKNELAQLNSAPFTLLVFCPAAFLLLAELPFGGIQHCEDYLSGADPQRGIQPGRLIFVLQGFPLFPRLSLGIPA